MELVLRLFGTQLTVTLGEVQYEEEGAATPLTTSDTSFGFTVPDPAFRDLWMDDEDGDI